MPALFDVENIFFTIFNYPMSHLEFWATITGGIAVWLSAKENVWSWILGLINVILAFFLFYQISLYPDMFLQVFFFVTNIIGFWHWKFPKQTEANAKNELKITKLSPKNIALLMGVGVLFTVLFGTFSSNLSTLFPKLFSEPTSFPYLDSFTTIMSIIATFLLIRKKVEAWWLWLVIDILATGMYFIKDVKLYALLYAIFVVIALFGALNWTKQYKLQQG